MAQKVQVLLVDDIDGGTADETVSFALDGVSYEIDLTTEHATELRDALATWVGHARKTGGRSGGSRGGSAGASRPRRASDAGAVRAWAKENGFEVSERGRISAEIREAYDAAH
ncbi:Lsr2 family protein [Cellulomonas sp. ES6]|uniref:histone-like nucleoid-structuring protein Lsr2 n=1 Tax=Cellulomonas sp. ES6 TaxID=3039384 RepID=UPI00198F1EB5|nr:Lsr2 family protein [Cellulomonas sp. ES6]MBD3779913.1 Lsr2 family protein [Micrococcales bacterium]WHP19103.1 Lsr2 family protein [Cellulomonas sp. ES6]